MKRFLLAMLIIFTVIPAVSQVKKTVPAQVTPVKKTVAVMNFNNYGASNISFLSNALPESISATLSEVSQIRIVERRQLGRLIQEITLEETGLVDTDEISRTGKLVKADFLMIGSLAGDTDEVIVTLKAVEVSTGKSVAGRVVKGQVGNIFDLSGQAARSMAAIISGEGVGTITVITSPSGSDIYIDGSMAGKSPIVEYKVNAGEHRIRAILSEYIDYETTLEVDAGSHEKVEHIMTNTKLRNRGFIGISGDYFFPIHKGVDGGPHFSVFAGQHFGIFAMQGELGFAKVNHDQNMPMFTGLTKEMERYYDFATLNAVITVAPFDSLQYISPYAGGLVGYTFITDRTPKKGADNLVFNDVQQLDKFHRLDLGAVLGITILPWSSASFFIESRYLFHPFKIKRQLYEIPAGSGEVPYKTERYFLTVWTIGGGVKFYF